MTAAEELKNEIDELKVIITELRVELDEWRKADIKAREKRALIKKGK